MRLRPICFTLFFFWSILLAVFAQEPVLLEHGGGVRTVAFSPVDAALLATAGESNIIKVWNLQENRSVNLIGHSARVRSVAFSPNGSLLASVSDDRTLVLWDMNNHQKLATLWDETIYQDVVFSPDGETLATGGGLHVKLWDVQRRVEVDTLSHKRYVRAVAFSPDGHFLAVGYGSDEGPGTVKVWDIDKRQSLKTLNGDPKNVKTVDFSADNRYLASSGWDGQLKIWRVSDWSRVRTIPHTGYYDISLSADGNLVASTNDGYVSLWWVEDGARVARLDGPAGWIHPVDFSHDGTSLAVGGEDGIVRIWRIDTGDGNQKRTVRILHVSTYFAQLPDVNMENGIYIPDPVPPPPIVRDYFQLDLFYEQWIDVEGLPVLASAKVNPYALKEAAWLIRKMIGHRPEILRAMAGKKSKFVVIAHNEIITEIPEYRKDAPPDFLIYRERGWGGSRQATVSSSEENILSYEGPHSRNYNVLFHEFAHGIHRFGASAVNPSFDDDLRIVYEEAMRKGLWKGTYASSDRKEYWAEGTTAWFYPKGSGSFRHFGNTRKALKSYDPGLAALLAEIYGDGAWRYTSPLTRTEPPHLQGYNPQEAPVFEGWPELGVLYHQLRDPNSDGGGEWVNLKSYNPNQLSRLVKSSVAGNNTITIFVNLSQTDVLVYPVSSDGTQKFWRRIYAGRVQWNRPKANKVYLLKDTSGRNIAVFKASERPGRAMIGANVDDGGSAPQVLIPQFQRPPMYWRDAEAGTLHRLIGNNVEALLPSVENATSLAVDVAGSKLYWAEKTSSRTGKIKRATLDGSDVKGVKDLTSVPFDIALDAVAGKLYLINAWGKVQRMNVDGSNFQPNLITDLKSPKHITLDAVGGRIYWTEQTSDTTGKIQRANLNGSNVQLVKTLTSAPRGIAFDTANRKLYLTNAWGKVQRLNVDGSNFQPNLITDLDTPQGVSVDVASRKIYWTEQDGIWRADLNGKNIETVATGVGAPTGIVLGNMPAAARAAPALVDLPPTATVLLANYPNPFNPETWIPYQLSAPAAVTVSLYDMKGALIRRLTIGHQAAGDYTDRNRAAYWDGRNAVGEPVASGVYFYTFTAGDFTATRKLLIRK